MAIVSEAVSTESLGFGGAPSTGDERRDSPRIPASFVVEELTSGGSKKERRGNISLGGAFWHTEDQPLSSRVEIQFQPESGVEVRALGEVIRVREMGTEFGIHVRFSDVPLDHELRLARFIQDSVETK